MESYSPPASHSPPALEEAVRLADIEWFMGAGDTRRNARAMGARSDEARRRPARSHSPTGRLARRVPKVHKPCTHSLAKKHHACEVCYECSQCKEVFLKKEKKRGGEGGGGGEGRGGEGRGGGEGRAGEGRKEGSKCFSCGSRRNKHVSQFVDCIIE